MLDQPPSPRDIREARKAKGLTQGEVADEVGISQPALSKIESGENDPTLRTFRMIIHTINQA